MIAEIILVIGFALVCAGSFLVYGLGAALLIAGCYLTVVAVLIATFRV